MNLFRRRILIVFLFAFISLGQAHPFAVAWAYPSVEECSCNHAGRKCIHGCHLKKRSKWARLLRWKPESEDRGSSDYKPCHGEKGEDSTDRWISPRCSKQHLQKWLSFQGDPFLLIGEQTFIAPEFSLVRNSFSYSLQGRILPCEGPPPKA